MNMETFAPFLRQAREKSGLTQSQLAEKMHVSTAAVSKWERGKSLPDVAKIEELAEILGVSVLEIMRGEWIETDAPEAELRLVYTETLQTTNRQRDRRWKRLVGFGLAAIILLTLIHYFPIYRIAQVWWPSYFETGEIAMLAHIGSREDRKTAEDVMEIAEEAFSDTTSTDAHAVEKYGLLARYARAEEGVVWEEHTLKLWSARFYSADGYMWVYYSREGKTADGSIAYGSWRIPSLWYLEKDAQGEWRVTYIKEHP